MRIVYPEIKIKSYQLTVLQVVAASILQKHCKAYIRRLRKRRTFEGKGDEQNGQQAAGSSKRLVDLPDAHSTPVSPDTSRPGSAQRPPTHPPMQRNAELPQVPMAASPRAPGSGDTTRGVASPASSGGLRSLPAQGLELQKSRSEPTHVSRPQALAPIHHSQEIVVQRQTVTLAPLKLTPSKSPRFDQIPAAVPTKLTTANNTASITNKPNVGQAGTTLSSDTCIADIRP